MRSIGSRLLGLAGWLALCFAAAAAGGAGSLNAPLFYGELARPSWAPPAWLFGPAWTALYTAMGVAAWLVWLRGPTASTRAALRSFLVQLAANAAWSWLFFAWRLGGWAFLEIVVLVGLVAWTLVLFWRVRPWAGALLLPYLAWVAFAALLNGWLWAANRAAFG